MPKNGQLGKVYFLFQRFAVSEKKMMSLKRRRISGSLSVFFLQNPKLPVERQRVCKCLFNCTTRYFNNV